ncbi:hypothetical protein D3C78_996360 [compost metagenome]
MTKPRPIIAEQNRDDIRKVSDLIEVAGSKPNFRRWCVDGVCYGYYKGTEVLWRQAGVSAPVSIRLDSPTAAAAKKAVFEDLRA